MTAQAASSVARRYCDFVQPGHALVQDLFASVPGSRETALIHGIECLRRYCAYEPAPGRLGFEEIQALRRTAGGRKVEVNCINSACLLTSHLRASGFTAEEAFVALGSSRRFSFHHAWTLLRSRDGLLWIDPVDLEPRTMTGSALWQQYVLFVIFNDEQICFLEEEKRRLLEGLG